MTRQDVSSALRSAADYLDKHGAEANLDLVAEQIRLAGDRLFVLRNPQALSPSVDMTEQLAEEQAQWGER